MDQEYLLIDMDRNLFACLTEENAEILRSQNRIIYSAFNMDKLCDGFVDCYDQKDEKEGCSKKRLWQMKNEFKIINKI
ncbi:unnamed protein product [Gordionus sp. m RMFG-2023]